MSIGTRLREEREKLGLTQAEIAEVAGVTRNSQYSYENDKRKPDADYLQAIAAAGCDVQYILTGQKSSQVKIAEPPKNYAVINRVKAEKLLDSLPADVLDDVLHYMEDKKKLADYAAVVETLNRNESA
jgi:transcriptional regulator with XRE-family HTH domain